MMKSPEAFIRFLNALPKSGNLLLWLGEFRTALRGFIGDVDHVMVDVNYLCDLDTPHAYHPQRAVTQYFGADYRNDASLDLLTSTATHAERILRGGGVRLSEFHPPDIFELNIADDAYLGSIILLRERCNPPISTATLALMSQLRPFLVFVMTDAVARHNFSRPIDRAFHMALDRIADDLGLTDREQEVLAAHLFGYPYQKIADQMHLGIDSVRKHVKAIHRKAGVATYTELFAKYFTPRVFAKDGAPANGAAAYRN